MNVSRIFRLMRDERGFTLQETVVVMIVSSVLVGFSYIIFQFVMHFLHTNLKNRERHESVQHVASVICTDIERSHFAYVSDSALVLERSQGSIIRYSATNGEILRNGTIVTPLDSSFWSLRWRETGDSTKGKMQSIAVLIQGRWKEGLDSISVSSRIPWSSRSAFLIGKARMKL